MSTRKRVSNSFSVSTIEDGQRGKTGRFFYFGAVWDTQDSTKRFSVSDAEAPYFYVEMDDEYYVYVGTQNFTDYTMDMISSAYGDPDSGNANWQIMYSDFKYIITEAIFGSYAHFGSAIINGDWMLSQHGTVNGVASTNYTAFDPSHPNDNTGTNFIPNYCVDLMTGTTYQQNAYVSGVIKVKATYTTIGSVSSGTYGSPTNIPLGSSPSNAYIVSGYSRLPSPTNYIGLQITLIFSANSVVLCNGDNSADGFITSGYGISNYSIGSNPVSRIGGEQTTTFNNIGAYVGGETLTLLAAPSGAFANRPIWVVVSQRGILRKYLSLPSLSPYNEMYPDGGMMLNE